MAERKENIIMRAKKLADYILKKGTNIKVDTPLSVYASTFIILGEEKGINGEEAFIQYALNTNYLKDNKNSEDEFPDIPKQILEILEDIEITNEAKKIVGDIK